MEEHLLLCDLRAANSKPKPKPITRATTAKLPSTQPQPQSTKQSKVLPLYSQESAEIPNLSQTCLEFFFNNKVKKEILSFLVSPVYMRQPLDRYEDQEGDSACDTNTLGNEDEDETYLVIQDRMTTINKTNPGYCWWGKKVQKRKERKDDKEVQDKEGSNSTTTKGPSALRLALSDQHGDHQVAYNLGERYVSPVKLATDLMEWVENTKMPELINLAREICRKREYEAQRREMLLKQRNEGQEENGEDDEQQDSKDTKDDEYAILSEDRDLIEFIIQALPEAEDKVRETRASHYSFERNVGQYVRHQCIKRRPFQHWVTTAYHWLKEAGEAGNPAAYVELINLTNKYMVDTPDYAERKAEKSFYYRRLMVLGDSVDRREALVVKNWDEYGYDEAADFNEGMRYNHHDHDKLKTLEEWEVLFKDAMNIYQSLVLLRPPWMPIPDTEGMEWDSGYCESCTSHHDEQLYPSYPRYLVKVLEEGIDSFGDGAISSRILHLYPQALRQVPEIIRIFSNRAGEDAERRGLSESKQICLDRMRYTLSLFKCETIPKLSEPDGARLRQAWIDLYLPDIKRLMYSEETAQAFLDCLNI